MRPIPHIAPEWTSVADFGPITEPTLVAGWDGTPTALLPPARSSPSHPRRGRTCSSARSSLPLAQYPRVRIDAPAADVMTKGLPAIVDDADGRPVGVFGLDELKIAAQRDPVLARSAR